MKTYKVYKKSTLVQMIFALFVLTTLCSSFQIFTELSTRRNLQDSNAEPSINPANSNTKIEPVNPKIIYPMNNMRIPTKRQANAQTRLNVNQNNIPNQNSQIPFYCSQRRSTNAPAYKRQTRQRLVSTLYGFNMYVDSKDTTVSNTIIAAGTWQPQYINLIGHIVKPGDYVMNLGSQSGLQALVMGKIIGPNGKLFIFQPYSFSNLLVTKNIELNQLTNITKIYKIGASDEKTTGVLGISYWNTGGSQITPKNPNQNLQNNRFYDGNNQHEQVQTDLVDSLLPQDIKLNFVLIDVQKMQIKALKGMKKLIQRSPNLVIMTEWQYAQNPRRNRNDTVQFLEWMINRGYTIYSYSGGDNRRCILGRFYKLSNIEDLLRINMIDIFFFPKDYQLPAASFSTQNRNTRRPRTYQNKNPRTNPINNNVPAVNNLPIPPNQNLNPIQQKKERQFYCSFSRSTVAPPWNGQTRQKQVTTNYGFNIFVDSRDSSVSNQIAFTGTWQPGYINLIGHLVKPGDSVINLGSQSGLQALIMGKIVGPTGRLFIFEPYSFSNLMVTKSVQLNNLTGITTIYKFGASDEKTTAVIDVTYSNTGGSQIIPKENSKTPTQYGPGFFASGPVNEQQQVQTDLVDALLPEDVKLDFALLDVQKMEIKALRGMKKIIERSPNLVIMTEWQYAQNPRHNENDTIEFLNWMVERGYKIYSYSGGNIGACTVGNFNEFRNVRDLLNISFLDVFFFPSTVKLP